MNKLRVMEKFCSMCGAQAVDDSSSVYAICSTQSASDISGDTCLYCGASIQLPVQKQGRLWKKKQGAFQPAKPAKTNEDKKSGNTIGLFIVVGGILFAIILLGIILPPKGDFFTHVFPPGDNSSGSSPISKQTTIPPSKLTSTRTPTPTRTPAPTRTPTPGSTSGDSIVPELLSLSIGEGASDGIASVMVFSATKTNKYSYYSDTLKKIQNETAPPGKIFIIVDAGIKNTGAPVLNASSSSFSLTDSYGFRYDPSSYETDGLTMQQLYLNQTSMGKILFIVPSGSKGLRLQYNFGDSITGPKLAAWPIK